MGLRKAWSQKNNFKKDTNMTQTNRKLTNSVTIAAKIGIYNDECIIRSYNDNTYRIYAPYLRSIGNGYTLDRKWYDTKKIGCDADVVAAIEQKNGNKLAAALALYS